MKNMLAGIKQISSVSQSQQQLWIKISKRAIKRKQVEPLSEKGLLQVIANMAYIMVTESHLYFHGVLNEIEWDNFLNVDTLILDDIQYLSALASGVHPDTIDEMLTIMIEQYHVMYDLIRVNHE